MEFRRIRNIGLERIFGDLGILYVSCPSHQFAIGGQYEAAARRGWIAADAGVGVATCICGLRIPEWNWKGIWQG
jgi:hypothetical protein